MIDDSDDNSSGGVSGDDMYRRRAESVLVLLSDSYSEKKSQYVIAGPLLVLPTCPLLVLPTCPTDYSYYYSKEFYTILSLEECSTLSSNFKNTYHFSV